jgi:hypothetical protein
MNFFKAVTQKAGDFLFGKGSSSTAATETKDSGPAKTQSGSHNAEHPRQPSQRRKRKSAAGSGSEKKPKVYQRREEMPQNRLNEWIERSYRDFQLRIDGVKYDAERIAVVRDSRVSIASVPANAQYTPRLLTDSYAYKPGWV